MVVESLDMGRASTTGKQSSSSATHLSSKDDTQPNSYYPRYTERLIKIFSVEEVCLAEDLAVLS